ncbi:MAG: HRDC domain-containing protein [Chloroflexota bacterium]
MHLDQLPKPVFVSQPAALQEMVRDLSDHAIIAVDTEANSLYAYYERVCLIQFSTPETDYLVDTFAFDDLSSLAPIFANPDIEKIFHAAEYDVLILRREFDFSFARIFDTMVAARILGWESVGLGALLESEFKIRVNKKYQRANWGLRPIPQEMLTYAQVDTHFLIALRNQLKTALKAKGLWHLALEDFNRSCHPNGQQERTPIEQCWRIKGMRDLGPQQLAVLRELCFFRDREAQKVDRPLFKVISNKALIEAATTWPSTLDEVQAVHGISPRQARRIGRGILAAVQRGKKADPPRPQRNARPNGNHLDRIDRLRRWRKNHARNLGVQSDIILPKDILNKIAAENPRSTQSLAGVMSTVPWRYQEYGAEILKQIRATK